MYLRLLGIPFDVPIIDNDWISAQLPGFVAIFQPIFGWVALLGIGGGIVYLVLSFMHRR